MSAFHAPISEQIWDMKYRLKDDITGEPRDKTVEDTWSRIAHALAKAEGLQEETPERRIAVQEAWASQFFDALADWHYTPAGRIVAGAGTGRAVTLFNCFVMGTIPDSMDGIFSMLREAALTMQQGGGIGYDFSTIRPKGALVKKLGADASGPLTFMDCWDAMCRTVMSAGSRRGAMMATMRCDHPDIEAYITAKQDAAKLRMFNLSVLVTDEFMEAVKAGSEWELIHAEPPRERLPNDKRIMPDGSKKYLYRTVNARELWDLIMRSTYDAAEPGVIFIDRINEKNNLRYCEYISSTNPCGEQPLPPYGACLLGSINLAKLVEKPFTKQAGIDREVLRKLVARAVRMMDNVVDVSNFPLEAQREEAKAKRRIGLGVTGLADALAMCCLTYGTEEAAKRTEEWMKLIDHEAYAASVEIAQEKGAFPLFDADKFLTPGTHASGLDKGLQDEIRKHGIRNALLTSIAPTGTISLYAGNVSSGIEPIFAFSYTRKVLQKDGSRTEELVEDYAVAKYREFWEDRNHDMMDRPNFDPERHLPDYFVSAQTLTPEAHVIMQAAAQKHVDSSISKTINCPEDISFEDFKDVYMQAWNTGCKGCTTYRPNDITGSVLSVEEKPKEEPQSEKGCSPLSGVFPNDDWPDEVYREHGVVRAAMAMVKENTTGPGSFEEFSNKVYEKVHQGIFNELPERPEELEGSTYKIKVGDQKAVYLTINDKVELDGTVRPFEIFLRSSDPSHDEWMVALARMISAIMRRPHPSSFIGPELMRIASPVSGGFQKGYGYRPSLVAAIGAKIKEHAERASLMVASDMKWSVDLPSVHPEDFDLKKEVSDFMDTARPKGLPCQKCGSYHIKRESGCETCMDCGHSKCG